MKISIISPWHGETGALLGDYYQTVQGSAQVISVDNACPAATATALAEMTTHLCGEYIRNEENKGFAAANNQGYAAATGDIIVFLNSDVAPAGPWLEQVARDVKDGALYGPSLQAQLVAGRHIPYIEGWCIAATRATWDKLIPNYADIQPDQGGGADRFGTRRVNGPWDALWYPGPYWEDNDLCLRALQAGIALIQTAWPVQHKGGQTAGPIMKYAQSFAANEHTFTQRVLAAIQQPEMTATWQRYMQAYHQPSDINHHIGLIYSLARGNVVELGTRGGVSTAALLAGVEARGGHVWSVDLIDCSGLFQHPQWTFVQGDSRNPELPLQVETPIDTLLIDTEHVYEVTTAELALWAPHMKPGGRILLHDTETFPGVRRAIREFCMAKGWAWTNVLPNNGMAIVEVSDV